MLSRSSNFSLLKPRLISFHNANLSDITLFIKGYRHRVNAQLENEKRNIQRFVTFNQFSSMKEGVDWTKDNYERFLKDTDNCFLVKESYYTDMGFITSLIYSIDGEYIVTGYSTGLIQQKMEILDQYRKTIDTYYRNEDSPKYWYPMFARRVTERKKSHTWVKDNYKKFLENTPNEILLNRWYSSECGYITALVYSKGGEMVIAGHANGLIQMRHGHSGVVLATLRNIQFPPRPVYSLVFSTTEQNICYAACTDGNIYRINIPKIEQNQETNEISSICSDPALEWLNTQYFGSASIIPYCNVFVTQRSPVLTIGITSDSSKMIIGSADTSIKVIDMETQGVDQFYKVHKLRLQFIPKNLQRIHSGQVVSVRCHNEQPHMFASAGWDDTLRIWDTRCKIGCQVTFEGVNICHEAGLDMLRNNCITGSWQNSEALIHWDLTAQKRLNIVKIQNRRPDVDGEYLYCCRYWRSMKHNRKGKYAIIGGSGTGCVEVINLHNRFISCSYPAPGNVLAVASYEDRIAFGGTHPVLNIVRYRDPKHEKYSDRYEYDVKEHAVTLFERTLDTRSESLASSSESAEPYIPLEDEMENETAKSDKDDIDMPKIDKHKPKIDKVKPKIDKDNDKPRVKLPPRCTDISKYPFRIQKVCTYPSVVPPPSPPQLKDIPFIDIKKKNVKKDVHE